jgi:Tannase-like family of unknown function (DUF6351)
MRSSRHSETRASMTGCGLMMRRTLPVVLMVMVALGLAGGPALARGHRHGHPRRNWHGHPHGRRHDHRLGQQPDLSIEVLSGRADLVSGGSALVAIDLPRPSDAQHVAVTVDHTAITSDFAVRADGRDEGLVSGLTPGRHVLKAILADGRGAQLTLVDHPSSGPLFSGPQLQPWTCETGATDAQCDRPATISYLYRSTDPSKTALQPYDPSNPASDVASTTTDQGVTVPFVVRVETGYMDRDQYQIAVLDQPGQPWTAVAPQPQFDHKLLITHGASCGVEYQTGTAPSTTSDAAAQYALGKGFMTMSTALDNSGHNCDLPLQAESLVMAKQYIATTYGTLRYTIGTGCSGGSLAQQWIANAYPGVYQGILPTCSFPDAWSTATEFLDYHLLLAYFKAQATWGAGVAWQTGQEDDVLGGPDGLQNAAVSDAAQFHVSVPTDPCNGTTSANRYNPLTNPGGIRCTIQDAAINVFGPEPQSLWSPVEQQLGHGFVRPPIDNVGVEYGLSALRAGQITPAEFVDLNAKVGGLDIDANPTAARADGGSPSLARAYRSGMINEANNLGQTAIIDCRGPNPGLFHDAYRAFAVRARLDRALGTHANQVIWEGPTDLIADSSCELNSFIAMDRWLGAAEADHSQASTAQKVIADKPADITDECWNGSGTMLSHSLCPAGEVNVEGTPRTVAGDAITTDDNKCELMPLRRSDYAGITFTDAQWAELQQTFPAGVCDFSRPGVGQQPTVPWLTYQDARGDVIYGGRPLGPPPTSTEFWRRGRPGRGGGRPPRHRR